MDHTRTFVRVHAPHHAALPSTPRARASARSGRLTVLLLAVLVVSGCVTVPPSQRGYLAKPEMNPATGALEEGFHSHVEAAREAGFGGHGTQGGGCGCG
jgi:hypothetical protein